MNRVITLILATSFIVITIWVCYASYRFSLNVPSEMFSGTASVIIGGIILTTKYIFKHFDKIEK